MSGALVEHSISLPNHVRVVAKREGIEVCVALNEMQEEVICLIQWKQIAHLQALAHTS